MISAEAMLLALSAAMFYGLALVITQFGLRYVAPADGALVSIPTMTALLWMLSPFVLDFSSWQVRAAAIFALVGFLSPGAIALLTYESNRRLGPNLTGTLGSTTPLFAAAVAVVFLGEQLTPRATVAILAIVAGVVTLSWRSKTSPSRLPSRLLALPLATAILRGLAQVFTKFGLTIWPSAFAASLIGYSISALCLAADARVRRGIVRPALNTQGVLWFALVGISNGAGVLTLYSALSLEAVTIVAPMAATYPLFALLFGALMLPDQRITLQSAAGTLLAVAGVIMLLLARES